MTIRWLIVALVFCAASAVAQPQRESPESKIEPDKLAVDPVITLDGKAFPEMNQPEVSYQTPKRILYAAPGSRDSGEGTESNPWTNLQSALCRLEPGDRLVLQPGIYEGSFEIGDECRDGAAEAPIQVFAEEAMLRGISVRPVLAIRRAHWQFWNPEIVLSGETAAGVAIHTNLAHHILLDDAHIYDGRGKAILVGDASSIQIIRCHIHHSGGVQFNSGTRDVELDGNHLHHNSGPSVTLAGPRGGGKEMESLVERIRITGNKLHNDQAPAIEARGAYSVRVTNNKIYNYRPSDRGEGEALVFEPTVSGVVIEQNYFAEASIAIHLGESDSKGGRVHGPDKVLIHNNYLENRLTRDATAIRALGGRDVRILNNVVDQYLRAFIITGASPRTEKFIIANNLIVNSLVPFEVERDETLTFFDHNLFTARSVDATVHIGDRSEDLEKFLSSGQMPRSKLLRRDVLRDRDLSRLNDLPTVDTGKVFPDSKYAGKAPDIGIADR